MAKISSSVLGSLNKLFSKTANLELNKQLPKSARLPTGMAAFDDWLGGGLPRGRLIELYGMESSGKSTLAIELARRAQKEGEHVVYIDWEISFESDYAESMGLDLSPERFLLVRPRSMEAGFGVAADMMRQLGGGFFIFDSLAAANPADTTDALFDREGKKQAKGSHSVAVSACLRAMNNFLGQSGAIALIINQIRTSLQGFKPTQTTPGGYALKFYAAQRWRIRRTKQIERNFKGKLVKIWEAEMTMTKTKTSSTEREVITLWIVPGMGVRVAAARKSLESRKSVV